MSIPKLSVYNSELASKSKWNKTADLKFCVPAMPELQPIIDDEALVRRHLRAFFPVCIFL